MNDFTVKLGSIWNESETLSLLLVVGAMGLTIWATLHPQSPGIAIGILAAMAGIMGLRPEMHIWERISWIVILAMFTYLEVRAIHVSDENNKRARDDQNQRFEDIAEDLKSQYALSQQQFDASMQRSEALHKAQLKTTDLAMHTLEQTECGDGYCFLTTAPPLKAQVSSDSPWNMKVDCDDKKKLLIVDVHVMVQPVLDENAAESEFNAVWHSPYYSLGTLPPGGWEPTEIALKPGKYNIFIYSRKNAVLEQTSFGAVANDPSRWNERFCVYKLSTMHLLTGNADCRSRR